jgi:hypothetical protein
MISHDERRRAHAGDTDDVLRRVYHEYLEMPGLLLTVKQAQRLFGLAERECINVLERLVDRRILARRDDGCYVRL